MTRLAAEIPFPMPRGRRDADTQGPEQQAPTDSAFNRSSGPIGPVEKAKRRDAIRTAILAAGTSTPPNPFPVAAMWDDALCREHPDFAPLLHQVDESILRARPLRDLVEAVNGKDIPTICRLWDPGLQGVSYMTACQRTVVRESIVSYALCNLPMALHRVDPLVFTSWGVEVRWAWPRTYRWLFTIAVRDKRYPLSPQDGDRAGQSVIKTAEQCRDGVALRFPGDFPHVCVWPAVTFEGELAYGQKPLRMACRRSTKQQRGATVI